MVWGELGVRRFMVTLCFQHVNCWTFMLDCTKKARLLMVFAALGASFSVILGFQFRRIEAVAEEALASSVVMNQRMEREVCCSKRV